MTEEKTPFHFVCTQEEAQELINNYDHFWVTNCECREIQGHCSRSRIDLCLWFYTDATVYGSGLHKADLHEVKGLLQEAKEKYLVARPFRYEFDMTQVGGICFCCDCCCEHFIKSELICDKGVMIEQTDMDICTHCSICEDVCYFDARKMEGDLLFINHDECYGCGLCRDICPEECIQMIPRVA